MPTSLRTPAAQRDLESIAFEIGVAHRRPTIADQIVDELISQCDKLANLASTAALGDRRTGDRCRRAALSL